MNIAVMGAGAVGCYFGGLLARAGQQVTLIARPAHVEAITKQHGLRFESARLNGIVPVRATDDPSGATGADVVLFCVKSADTETAGREIAPHLKAGATVICLQNSVDNAERLQAIIPQTVLPAAVYVAAEMAGPGHILHHGRGDLIIGASDASESIAAAFNAAQIPTSVSKSVIAVLWEKLIINCAYNALSATGHLPYGRLIEVPGAREVMSSAIDECVAVASKLDIAIPADIHARALALVEVMPKQYSSTAQDLARGKPTEIDYLNGHVVKKGREVGVPTPTNLALQVAVKLREAGRENRD